MFENATKEDLVTVLNEMGETVDSDLGVMELKQKLLLCKAYLEDEEFVCDVLATMIEDRMEKGYRKRAEERRLERKGELELARIEARRKTENETTIRETRHKEEKETRLRVEEEARPKDEEETRFKAEEKTRLKAEEEARLKAEEEAKVVEERRKAEEEKRVNETIALKEEMRLEKERWHVEEQMRHVQEHKTRMKAKEQELLEEERCKRIDEQNQLLNEEQEKLSDEDMEIPQATEKALAFKSERAQLLSVDPDAVAQPVAVEEEKGLSRDSSNVPLISAEDEMFKEKEETPVDVIKDKAKGNINPL
ncbi:hypothetical protein TNIN_98521 [Trichonephila inaurata madagascariensis]|uniref:Uncharacterized protein n=1 Tax=Trichonephila inaurata madagascariensis TaxID=2747483 RepID=A0A8X7CCS5_9ARAC|nr:hypothetical protein TNIN_98521 [Trichonephila inaurata madagascariensis]